MNQLKAGAAISYLTILMSNIIGLLYTPFMLRMMGQEEYGLYSLVASVVAYLTVLDMGFGNAVIRYTAKYRAEEDYERLEKMFGMFILLFSVIGIITFAAGLVLTFNVSDIFDRNIGEEGLWKVRIMMLLMTLNLTVTFPLSVFSSIITAYERFVFQKGLVLVRTILNPAVMIVMLMIGYKAIGMVVIISLFNIVTLLINTWYCFKKIKIKISFGQFEKGFFKEVSIYSFWIFLSVVIDKIYWSTGQFVLGIYQGATPIAIYAVSIQLVYMYMNFSKAISDLFLPKVTAIVTKSNDHRLVSDLFIKVGRLQYIVICFILIGFIIFGKAFIAIWAGRNYADAYLITLILFIPLTIPLIQNLGIIILQAHNKMKFRSVLYLIIALFSLAVSVPLAKVYSGLGCAIAVALALFLGQIVVMNIYYMKRIRIDIVGFWREIVKMSIAPSVLGVAAYIILMRFELTKLYMLVGSIAIFSVIYIPVAWFFVMNNYERGMVVNAVKRIISKS